MYKDGLPSIPTAHANPHQFHSLIENSPDVFSLVSRDGFICYINKAGEKLLRCSSKDLIGRPAYHFIHPADVPRLQQTLCEIRKAAGKTVKLECRLILPNGSDCWIEGSITNLLEEPGVEALVNQYRDITPRKRVEQLLQESQQHYRLIVDYSSDIISLVDLNGSWHYVSPSVERILGYSSDEIKAFRVFDLVHPEDLATTQTGMQDALKGEVAQARYRYRHKDGRWIVLETTGMGIMDEQGRPTMAVFTSHDITQHISEELEKDALLGMVSHELRTPLTTIKMSVQLALRQIKRFSHAPTEDVIARLQEVLVRADRSITLANRLVSDLLDVSRFQANTIQLHLKFCNLIDIVRMVVSDIQTTVPERKLILNIDQELDMVPVVIDVERIGQVLTNYLTNALKYTPTDAAIEVFLTCDKQAVYVHVKDNGPGLTVEEQQKIWQRFTQLPDRIRYSGTVGLGLGLYICQTIISLHQGMVGVESKKGQGSTFWFRLPLYLESWGIDPEADQ